ncbi:hypothetical protein ACUL41_02965 [Virgibacillus natechei]
MSSQTRLTKLSTKKLLLYSRMILLFLVEIFVGYAVYLADIKADTVAD